MRLKRCWVVPTQWSLCSGLLCKLVRLNTLDENMEVCRYVVYTYLLITLGAELTGGHVEKASKGFSLISRIIRP